MKNIINGNLYRMILWNILGKIVCIFINDGGGEIFYEEKSTNS